MSKTEIRRRAIELYNALLDKRKTECARLKAYHLRVESQYSDRSDVDRLVVQAAFAALIDAALSRVENGYAVDPRIAEAVNTGEGWWSTRTGEAMDTPCSSWLFLS